MKKRGTESNRSRKIQKSVSDSKSTYVCRGRDGRIRASEGPHASLEDSGVISAKERTVYLLQEFLCPENFEELRISDKGPQPCTNFEFESQIRRIWQILTTVYQHLVRYQFFRFLQQNTNIHFAAVFRSEKTILKNILDVCVLIFLGECC